jgi:hypothetical protein
VNKEELQRLIDAIEKNNLKGEADFGIFQYGGGPDESLIKANPQGLALFAAQLLKAAKEAEDQTINSIPLDIEESWVDKKSSIFIQYIQLIKEKQEKIISPHATLPSSAKDKFFFAAGILVLVLLLITLGVGIWTIIKWLL